MLSHSTPAPDVAKYAWLSARARNALRHWAAISIVVGTTFIAVLIGLVLIPRQANRAANIAARGIPSRPDSAIVLATRERAVAEIERIDSSLTAARRLSAGSAPSIPVDTLAPELRAERDSLNALLIPLNAAMARAAEAPLPLSFRALGETPALRDDPHVRGWLDSLALVDKLRAPFGALGAGDPIYVALTARVNEIGRSIRDAADMRRSELRSRLAPLMVQPVVAPPPTTSEQIDTTPLLMARVDIVHDYAVATRTLDSIRIANARIDAASSNARDLANIGAPPAAMLTAAFVIALAFGFSAVFAKEVRSPTIAHSREAEAVAAARVLTTIRSIEVVDRGRRKTDLAAPPLINLISESYRTLYLHLAATDASVPIVTVTGDIPAIVATVAANLAAVAAYEARSTLLVDTDMTSDAVATVLRLKTEPGLSSVLRGDVELSDAIVSTTIGRDRPLDVLPSGAGRSGSVRLEYVEQLRNTLMRMERRYDFIVIAAPTSYAQLSTQTIIPAADAIVCARVGETRLSDLRTAVKSLRGIGRYVHGLVLWEDETPRMSVTR